MKNFLPCTQRNTSGASFKPKMLWVALLMVLSLNQAFAQYGGGDGTAGNPYKIGTLQHLRDLSANSGDWDKHFEQTADINASATENDLFTPITLGSRIQFTGSYNGNEHRISNLHIHLENGAFNAALFSTIGSTGIVSNIVMVNANVICDGRLTVSQQLIGGSVAAFICSINDGGVIENCVVEGGTVDAENIQVGGIAARNTGIIRECAVNNATLKGISAVGGIVGENKGQISACQVNSLMLSGRDGSSIDNAGGLVGEHLNVSASECFVNGVTVIGGGTGIGGFSGIVEFGNVSDSYVINANINASNEFGGFFGKVISDILSITNCYVALTTLVGPEFALKGPFVTASNLQTKYTSCYYDAGAVTENSGITGLFGVTTASMKLESTYVDWDFVDVWSIDAGQNDGFPTLNAVPAAGGSTCEEPVITQQPEDVTIQVGEDASFTVAATGDDLTYQWEVSGDNNSYAPLTNETAATFSSTFNEQGTYYYRVQIYSGECSVTSEVATLTVTEAISEPAVYTGAIDALANEAIAIPVMIDGFEDFQTLQGNVDFGDGSLAFIDSVVVNETFSELPGLDGTYHIIDNRLTYSYDNLDGNFTLEDGTVLFTMYGHLVNTDQNDVCVTPFDNEAATPHQFGRMVDNAPEITVPQVSFETICANGGEDVVQSFQVDEYAIPCPGEAITLPVSYTGYFDPASGFTVTLGGETIATFGVGEFWFTVPADLLVAGSNVLTITNAEKDFSATHDLALDEFATPTLTVNGLDFDADVDYCPGTVLSIALAPVEENLIWSYSLDGGTTYSETTEEHTLDIPTEGMNGSVLRLQVQMYNDQGCLSEEVHVFDISVQDVVAPEAVLAKTYYPYWGSEEETLTLDDLVFSDLSDNCDNAGDLVIAFEGGVTETTISATGTVGVTVTDAAGNVTELEITVVFFETPAFELRQQEYLTTYYSKNENEETITVGAHIVVGDDAFLTGLSGTVDFGAFIDPTREVIITSLLGEEYGTFEFSHENGVVTYTMNFNPTTLSGFESSMDDEAEFTAAVAEFVSELEAGIFEVVFEPNLVVTGQDEAYFPSTGAADDFALVGSESAAKVKFENMANTLEGVSEFSVSLTDELGAAFTENTEIRCYTCLEDNEDLTQVHAWPAGAEDVTFYTLSENAVTIDFTDNSGKESTVGTEDAIANRQYIINSRDFDAMQIAKADVDNNEDINTLDVLQMRENTVGSRSSFVNAYAQESPFNYLYSDSEEPLSYGVVADYSLAGIATKTFDFTVFTIGNLVDPEINLLKSGAIMALSLGSTSADAGELVSIPVTAGNFEDVAGYQFTVNWNAGVLSYQGISGASHAVLSGERLAEEGTVGISWIDNKAANASLSAGDTLFMLHFEVLPLGTTNSTQIDITSAATPYAAYNEDLEPLTVTATSSTVNFTTTSITDLGNGYGIGNPYPNPFADDFTVVIELPARENVSLRVYDSRGKVLERQELMEAGLNYWTMENPAILKTGMYFLEVQCAGFKKVMKLIRQ